MLVRTLLAHVQNTFGSRGAGHCPRPALTAALRRCAAATGTLPRAAPLPKRPLPREMDRDFRGGGRPSRQRSGRRHRVRRDTAADPADGGGEDLREAATGGSRRQAPCASCSTMDKHAYAQMRPVLSRRAQRASTTQPATGRPETIPPVERARANCLPYSQRRSLENAPDIEGPGLQPWSKGGRCG